MCLPMRCDPDTKWRRGTIPWYLAAGVVVAIWLIQGLQEALFHVDLADPLVLAGVPLVLVATGLLASLVPALRASRVDPTDAMRAE